MNALFMIKAIYFEESAMLEAFYTLADAFL